MALNAELLTDSMSGSYAVGTGSGTVYAVYLDEPRAIVRLAQERVPTKSYEHLPSAVLRRDGETIKLLKIVDMRVGSPALLLLDVRLDGIPTLRTTTSVVSITPLQVAMSE